MYVLGNTAQVQERALRLIGQGVNIYGNPDHKFGVSGLIAQSLVKANNKRKTLKITKKGKAMLEILLEP